MYSSLILLKYAKNQQTGQKNGSEGEMCSIYIKCVWLLNSRKTTFVGPCLQNWSDTQTHIYFWNQLNISLNSINPINHINPINPINPINFFRHPCIYIYFWNQLNISINPINPLNPIIIPINPINPTDLVRHQDIYIYILT